MNTDTTNSKESLQDEDKFWVDFERQYFTVPHPSLIACLKNHVWHCKNIYNQAIQLLTNANRVRNDGGTPSNDLTNSNSKSKIVPKSIRLPIKSNRLNKKHINRTNYPDASAASSGIFKYLNSQYMGSLSNEQVHWILENDDFFNPLVSAKHNNQRLPTINSTSLPDAIHLTIYHPDPNTPKVNIVDAVKYGNGFVNASLPIENIPEILYGPSPVWLNKGIEKYKTGCEIGTGYIKCNKLLKNPKGYIYDPVWLSKQHSMLDNLSGSTDLLEFHSMSDSSATSKIDYSPLLYNFVLSKQSILCKRCLGMPKLSCSLCRTEANPTVNHSKNVCFNTQLYFDDKYQMVYNYLDISHMRNSMDDNGVYALNKNSSKHVYSQIRCFDDEIKSVLYNYLQTLNKLGNNFEVLIKRVENDHRRNHTAWLDVENKMLQNYIDQYNNKILDTRYSYTTQKQCLDLLRLRLNCPKSSCLPTQWTDCALCSICGSDEDWDDDPILFCDCCYIPMHFCCLGFKSGTLAEVSKHYRRRQFLMDADDDDSIIDEDEWLCPSCLFLFDQISFIDESTSFSIIRSATGPRYKQQIDFLSKDIPQWDDYKYIENVKLPVIVGFEYDNPYERIHICNVYPKDANEYIDGKSVDLKTIISTNNSPLLMLFNGVPKVNAPKYDDLPDCIVECIGHSFNQIISFPTFSSRILKGNKTLFEQNFHLLLSTGEYSKLSEYLNYVPHDDLCLSRLIQQDRIVESNKAPSLKKPKKDKPESAHKPLRVNSIVEVEEQYSMNCKNPLMKMVLSVNPHDGVYVNLKIPICIFCGFDAYIPGGGPMKRTSNMGTWGHVKCAQGMDCTITPSEIDYSTFVPKIKALKCIICHNWGTAIIQCSYGSCCKAFHIPCAASSPSCLYSWDTNGRPDVLCPLHASGIAPTALLRKLQNRIQQQKTKGTRELRSSVESISPKDDVYLTHFLHPNYRSIVTLIENVLNKRMASFPTVGLAQSLTNCDKSESAQEKNENDINCVQGKQTNQTLSTDSGDICPIINDKKANCLWCCVGMDESSHYRQVFDDRTPSSSVIGSIIFSDYDAVKRECNKVSSVAKYNTTPGVISQICGASNIVDDKMCLTIANDFIDGKKLIPDVETSVYRSSFNGLTRLLNILHADDYDGDMVDCFRFLINHINLFYNIDNERRSTQFNSKSMIDIFNCLDPLNYVDGNNMIDNPSPILNAQVKTLLSSLNKAVFTNLSPSMIPTSVLRSVGSMRQIMDPSEITSLCKDFGICHGCLEIKANEQYYILHAKRKRCSQAEYFKRCTMCNVNACGNCLRLMNLATESDEEFESIQDFTFTCIRCQSMINNPNLPLLCCVLCSRFDGLLVKINPNLITYCSHWACEWNGFAYAHLVCLELLTWNKQVGATFRKLPKVLFENPCCYCGLMAGATIQCTSAYCTVRFHAYCAAILGCKIDMSKKIDGPSSTRRVTCLRHTFVSIGRSSPVERKFLVAPSFLYEVLASIGNYIKLFFNGVYLSQYCMNSKVRMNVSKEVAHRAGTASRKSRTYKSSDAIKQRLGVLKVVNYINLGLIAPSNKTSVGLHDTCLSDNIARDRLIQAMNYASMNGMNTIRQHWDKKDIKLIISMIKSGLLKPIQGSKRGRKPKSLDGSDHDRRHKMPMEDILKYGHSGQMPSGEFYCPICFCIYFESAPGLPGDDLHWIGCDRCERWFHFVCVGVWMDDNTEHSKGDWYCPNCIHQVRT